MLVQLLGTRPNLSGRYIDAETGKESRAVGLVEAVVSGFLFRAVSADGEPAVGKNNLSAAEFASAR